MTCADTSKTDMELVMTRKLLLSLAGAAAGACMALRHGAGCSRQRFALDA